MVSILDDGRLRLAETKQDVGEDVVETTVGENLASESMEVINEVNNTANGEKCAEDQQPQLSKNQMKKMKRLERHLERRKEIRVFEKARKKERRQLLKDQGKGELLKKPKLTKMAESNSKVNIVVDMAYEENLIRNTIAQLSFCYSANRKAPNPMQYHVTGMTDKTLELFHQVQGTENWDVHVHSEPLENLFPSEDIVYLSSDSDNLLEKLEEEQVYVIGGLLDHNRYPGVSHRRAIDNGWKHAKLPISEFIKMNSRKILAINHVFEILLHFYESGNWEKAFFEVIPKRKGAQKIGNSEETKKKGPLTN